jgi:hypothetical protein
MTSPTARNAPPPGVPGVPATGGVPLPTPSQVGAVIGNPLSGFTNAAGDVMTLIRWFQDPRNIFRIMKVSVGAALIVGAGWMIVTGQIIPPALRTARRVI